MQKRIFVNNQIRAKEVRVIGEDGKQIGVLPLEKALQLAKEKNLDLVQVTERVNPPVCKIADAGKFIYNLQKKERKQKPKGGELKAIRLRFNISPHDLNTRVNQAERFLKEGDKVRIEMILRGREKKFDDFAKRKIETFLSLLKEKIEFKIERELKKEPRGFTLIIVKK